MKAPIIYALAFEIVYFTAFCIFYSWLSSFFPNNNNGIYGILLFGVLYSISRKLLAKRLIMFAYMIYKKYKGI